MDVYVRGFHQPDGSSNLLLFEISSDRCIGGGHLKKIILDIVWLGTGSRHKVTMFQEMAVCPLIPGGRTEPRNLATFRGSENKIRNALQLLTRSLSTAGWFSTLPLSNVSRFNFSFFVSTDFSTAIFFKVN